MSRYAGRRLLAVLAHPDDESLGFGGTLARYADEGAEVFLITATRGERGRAADGSRPGAEVMGQIREQELRAAARELGIREVYFLGYLDAELDQVDPIEAIGRIAARIRQIRPDVVLTFGPDGGYGHPDHIAISQLTTAAVTAAAYAPTGGDAHQVAKLYYMAWGQEKWNAYQAAVGRMMSRVDDVDRQANVWPDWAITTRIDTRAYWPVVWRAVQCHASQIGNYANLGELPRELHEGLWGSQEFYRAMSQVTGGRVLETDLFEGLTDGYGQVGE